MLQGNYGNNWTAQKLPFLATSGNQKLPILATSGNQLATKSCHFGNFWQPISCQKWQLQAA